MSQNNGINDIRKLSKRLSHGSLFFSATRVLICDEAQGLSRDGQSAWLKELEEPLNGAGISSHWILVTTNPEKLSGPVRSRCQLITLHPPTPEQIVGRLVHIATLEGLKVDESMSPLFFHIARSSGGHVRDAIMSLELVLPLLLTGEDPNSLIKLIEPIAA